MAADHHAAHPNLHGYLSQSRGAQSFPDASGRPPPRKRKRKEENEKETYLCTCTHAYEDSPFHPISRSLSLSRARSLSLALSRSLSSLTASFGSSPGSATWVRGWMGNTPRHTQTHHTNRSRHCFYPTNQVKYYNKRIKNKIK